MLNQYGLKALEYLLYGLAVWPIALLIRVQSSQTVLANDLIAISWILIGSGILIPRLMAYRRWAKVIANVGSHEDTWDGDRSAHYTYTFDGTAYRGKYRSMHGSFKYTQLPVSVNPHAPWVRYLILRNLWFVGAVLILAGLVILIGGFNPF